MMRQLLGLGRDRRGAAAMEMALITPVVGGMLLAALDFSGAWLARLQLEQAAQRGIEAVANRRGVATDYSYALADAQAAYGKPLQSAVLDNWLECGGVRQASLTTNCNGQQRARYVSIRLVGTYDPVFNWGGLLSSGRAGNGYRILGDAAVRIQ